MSIFIVKLPARRTKVTAAVFTLSLVKLKVSLVANPQLHKWRDAQLLYCICYCHSQQLSQSGTVLVTVLYLLQNAHSKPGG